MSSRTTYLIEAENNLRICFYIPSTGKAAEAAQYFFKMYQQLDLANWAAKLRRLSERTRKRPLSAATFLP